MIFRKVSLFSVAFLFAQGTLGQSLIELDDALFDLKTARSFDIDYLDGVEFGARFLSVAQSRPIETFRELVVRHEAYQASGDRDRRMAAGSLAARIAFYSQEVTTITSLAKIATSENGTTAYLASRAVEGGLLLFERADPSVTARLCEETANSGDTSVVDVLMKDGIHGGYWRIKGSQLNDLTRRDEMHSAGYVFAQELNDYVAQDEPAIATGVETKLGQLAMSNDWLDRYYAARLLADPKHKPLRTRLLVDALARDQREVIRQVIERIPSSARYANEESVRP